MMKKTAVTLRKHLLLFTALGLTGGVGAALAQSAPPAPVVVPGDGAAPDLNTQQIETVQIHYKKLLLKEKDIANAVTELKPKDIKAENPTMGSIQTLLNKTPSVVAYAQGPGQSATTLAIRGVRNDELAETLDGVPLSDLLNGSGDYLSNNVGSPVTLNELDGVNVYPGVAPPDHQGFGSVGGTIAYQTKQPTDERYEELEGGFGSFDTQHVGFVINTGKLYDDVDAPKALMVYDQSQTAGFISNTNAQYHDFMLNVVKPYDNGLSHVGLVIIFNQGKGNIQTEPAPVALINEYGYKYNFPKSLGFYNQTGKDLTTILSDQTYLNQYMIFSGSLFYLHQSDTEDSYAAPSTVLGGYPYTPNVQADYDFFGCFGPDSIYFYAPGLFTYTPGTTPESCAAGESSTYNTHHYNEIGIDPKLNIFLPYNTITIGGLIAKASSSSAQYVSGGTSAQFAEDDGYNSSTLGGAQQRTAYVAYIQDKIDLLNNHLHILPGARVTAAYSSNIQQVINGSFGNLQLNPDGSANYAASGGTKFQNFSKVGEPYIGVSYDAPYHFIVYGSYGKGSLFAPTSYYSAGATGLPGTTNAPTPEIEHVFEGGLRYDTPRLYLNVDYYYQKIDDAFAFYTNYALDQEYYSNVQADLYRGVEMSGQFQATPDISIYANGSYIKTAYLKTNYAFVTLQQDQYGYGFKGQPISNVPDWTGNIGIDYDHGPYSARLDGQYTGREYETYDLVAEPLATNPLNGATVTNTKILNPANFVVNLLLSYDLPIPKNTPLKNVNLSLNILNMFDEHYYNYRYSSDTANDGVYSINPAYDSAFVAPPRSFTLDLTAKF